MYHYYFIDPFNKFGSVRELCFDEATKLAHEFLDDPVMVHSDYLSYGDTTVYYLTEAVKDENYASGYKGTAHAAKDARSIVGVDLSWFIPINSVEVRKPASA
jgi:hypothetical protein